MTKLFALEFFLFELFFDFVETFVRKLVKIHVKLVVEVVFFRIRRATDPVLERVGIEVKALVRIKGRSFGLPILLERICFQTATFFKSYALKRVAGAPIDSNVDRLFFDSRRFLGFTNLFHVFCPLRLRRLRLIAPHYNTLLLA